MMSPVLHRLAGFVVLVLVHHREGVARLDVALEIDVEAVEMDQLDHDRRRNAEIDARDIEARIDRRLAAHEIGGERLFRHVGEEAGLVAADLDDAVDRGVETEAEEAIGLGAERTEGQCQLLADLQLARIVDRA